jgi:hypothetical protein
VFAPPPDFADVFTNPERPAGFTQIQRTSDQRAEAGMLLGGVLGEGEPPPRWPVTPGASFEHDRNRLA